ncbi:ribonuclease T2 family protein [Litchfieldella xinjiangensis]|uniref:ribonuclease T2 family protein n=1 Tax=Litchfieldella xinjiangensis TaxID=1166948 RepID=UPI0009E0AD23|nr:ribonuclease I [Halomonas xinjiangensis]
MLAGLLGLMACSAMAGAQASLPTAGFDHYTLALTWHPGFCTTQSNPPRECREPSLHEGSQQKFVLHGLWPSLPERFAEQGVDRRQWWGKGCFLERPRAQGSFCRVRPAFDLPQGLSSELDAAMPGRASCLDRYQYAKHAACLSLPETAYFELALALLETINASAFVDFVVLNQGGEVNRNALIDAFEAAFGHNTGRALRLECRGRGNRTLTEVRIGIAAERVQAFPAADSLVPLGRGRCATRVRIATFD